jgi:type VI protein secretion system component VasK
MARGAFRSSLVGTWIGYLSAIGICYAVIAFLIIPFLSWQKAGVWAWPTTDRLFLLAKLAIYITFFAGAVSWAADRWDKKDKRNRAESAKRE